MKKDGRPSALPRVILVIFCTLVTLIMLLSGFFNFTVCNADKMAKKVVNTEFVDTAYELCLDDLESQCLYLVLPFEEMAKCVDKAEIKRVLLINVKEVFDAVFNKNEFNPVFYNSEYFKGAVDTYLDNYLKENAVTVTDGAAEEITAALTGTVDLQLDVVNVGYIDEIRNMKPLMALFGLVSFVFIPSLLLTAILVFMIIILYRKNMVGGVYYALTACWAGVVVIFIPAILIKLYNLPDKLIFSRSVIKIFLANGISTVSDSLVLMSALIFSAFSIGLLITYSLKKKNKEK